MLPTKVTILLKFNDLNKGCRVRRLTCVLIERDNITAFDALIKHKDIDINAKCAKGVTALGYARKNGSMKAIEMILSAAGATDEGSLENLILLEQDSE